jgi:PPOX class probable F420-dependent enzyme
MPYCLTRSQHSVGAPPTGSKQSKSSGSLPWRLTALRNPIRSGSSGQPPSTVLIYSQANAYRLEHIDRRPRVALHFDGNARGGNVVVLTGDASIALDAAPPHEHPDYLAKYRESMIRVSGSPEGFSDAYPVPVRIVIDRIRGF